MNEAVHKKKNWERVLDLRQQHAIIEKHESGWTGLEQQMRRLEGRKCGHSQVAPARGGWRCPESTGKARSEDPASGSNAPKGATGGPEQDQ